MKSKGWIDILSTRDDKALWAKLFAVISRHSAVRMLHSPSGITSDGARDVYGDLTQELFLRLHQKDRWRYYLTDGYTDEEVEQELYRIEVPNLVSRLQRERCPESYRIARRISDLLQARPEFRHFAPSDFCGNGGKRPCNKMALKLYGLSVWLPDKPVKPASILAELAKDIPIRPRDTRRTGRGSGSQVVISNDELKRLMLDVFVAIDSPADVRTMRTLVLSKLTIEDCRVVSIDAATVTQEADGAMARIDFADHRPTPLDILLEKETTKWIDGLVEELLESMKRSVRNKPHRLRKLTRVAWHCYFDPSSPSQTTVAHMMGISASLVSHYRGIFDSLVLSLALKVDELITFNSILEKRLGAMLIELKARDSNSRPVSITQRARTYSESADLDLKGAA